MAKDVIEQDSRLFMASLDLELLFTNIPLEETIFLVISFLGNKAKINNFNRNHLEKLLRMALQNSFDGKTYKQTDGVAMCSPLGPSLDNTFYVFMDKYGSMIALKILNMYITDDM